ncbi:Sterol 3-beta-glucosyltransferase [Xylographa trunciseda]|nr:Sterol 3-beta-glucosyltransferase [Xylographa trunciseda]
MEPRGEEHSKRFGRKLTKLRKPNRHASVQYPERLQPGDDVQEDVTAPKGKMPTYMNQSVFGMIAAAGSKSDFHARFDDDSSGSSDDEVDIQKPPGLDAGEARRVPKDVAEERTQTPVRSGIPGTDIKTKFDKRIRRSLPKLHLRTSREKKYLSQSTILPSVDPESPKRAPIIATPRDAPLMSRMLEAQAQMKFSTADLKASAGVPEASKKGDLKDPDGTTTLVTRLKEIFGFAMPEEVISEYPCWLLQSVLLQGYMYITDHHICFYAYLPKKSNIIAKSGYLSKRGKQNPKFSRYWFTLKGDVLSYYTDPSDLYFPSGNIDLRYGISAALAEHKDKSKDILSFTVITHQRTYFLRADSSASAKEWVKTLQKVIFRSHNDGDSVKISLPIENVIDVEESPVIDFAETIKIRVVDSDETYAIDEYFFSFFSFGRDAFDVLRALVDDTTAQKIPVDFLAPSTYDRTPSPRGRSQDSKRSPYLRSNSPLDLSTPILRESVHATLSPGGLPLGGRGSPRASGEWTRPNVDQQRKSTDMPRKTDRTAFDDRGRRSASTSRMGIATKRLAEQSQSSKPQGSSDSFVHSLEPSTVSSMPNQSSDDMQASASQILNRSDVFNSPTIHHLQRSPSRTVDESRRESTDIASPISIDDSNQVQLPSRAQTYSSGSKQVRHDQLKRASTDDFASIAGPHGDLEQYNSTPTLQQLVKAGSYPLQRAAGFAGFLRRGSKKMSNLLATESMGYVEKVSGMWAGGRRHYGDAEGIVSEYGMDETLDEDDPDGYGSRFRAHFALAKTEKLQATYFGYLHRVLPLYGKIYISNRSFCFRSLLPGTKTKMVLPLKDIENVDKEKGFRFGYSGLVIVIRAFEELFFEFRQSDLRDDCAVTLLHNLESIRFLHESGLLTQEDKAEAATAKAEHNMLQAARLDGHNERDLRNSVDTLARSNGAPPILFDDPRASILNFKPTESMRITCLTIGSRGDVQPYIALCKGFLAEGHRPKIATHAEFEPWIRKHGIDFAPVDGDPAELMRICVENGMFTYSFLKEASVKFRGWIDELLSSAWTACQETDLLIESPSAMAGIHIAEALGIPYFRAFTMPWTRTRAYPHAFAVPEHKMGGAYNYVTYVMFDNVFWTAIAGQVNRWRKRELGLRSTNLDKLHPNKVPFLYNFSPSVVVPPLDYSDWIRVTGYWFLDEASDWSPPKELTDFIKTARNDQKKIVYIGFGSIVVSDPAVLTKTVVESVLKADVRCILSKGWSDRLGNKDAMVPEVPLPAEILQIKSAPHDWLFKHIDAAAHHGGAGTTGASLRAGLPTIIKPFFGDQFFFGSRVEDLGVGICLKKLNISVLSRALWEATHSERMIIKAKVIGEQIRKVSKSVHRKAMPTVGRPVAESSTIQEKGVETAIQAIYRDLEYARTLIKHRGTQLDNENGDEESWTFIGDDSDPELVRRIAEREPMGRTSRDSRRPSRDGRHSSRDGRHSSAPEGAALGTKLLRERTERETTSPAV